MRKKYFTDTEKREARKLEAKRYYERIKKPKISDAQKKALKKLTDEKRKKYLKEYYQRNKEKILNQSKIYFKNNQKIKQDKNNKRYKERRDSDPLFKLSTNLRRNLRTAFNKGNFSKKSRSYEILGCSFEKFKQHLESLFEPWMNWENYGLYNGELNYGWDIDHIIPNSSALTEDEVIKLNHYTNLQPLCSKVNRDIKRDKI